MRRELTQVIQRSGWGVLVVWAVALGACPSEEPRTVAGFHWRSDVSAPQIVTYQGYGPLRRLPAHYRTQNCRVRSTAHSCGQIDMGSGVSIPMTCWDDDTYCDYTYDVTELRIVATTQGQDREVVPPTAVGTRVDHCWVRFATSYGGDFVPVACERWREFPRGRQVFRSTLPDL